MIGRGHTLKSAYRILTPPPALRPTVSQPHHPARARPAREDLPCSEVIHGGLRESDIDVEVSRHAPRAVSAALVVAQPLAHPTLDNVVRHGSEGYVSSRAWLDISEVLASASLHFASSPFGNAFGGFTRRRTRCVQQIDCGA